MSLDQHVTSAHESLRLLDIADRGRRNGNNECSDTDRVIVGKSASIIRCLDLAKKAANSRSTVLLFGESGTGKEIFARAIHDWSDRKSRPFIAINCVGLAKELLESELFGHEKGAFTGAYQLKKGKMELAHGGTVLLDEIGDISPDLQVKLLRFLQEREFERVGGTRPIRVDVRIIAATNRKLDEVVGAGSFRGDLYHRLNVIPITLPPLRERKEDVSQLAHHFLKRFAAEANRKFVLITSDALQKLCAYDWPGNVRELANVIEQAVVLGPGPSIGVKDLPSRIVGYDAARNANTLSYRDAVNGFRKELISQTLAATGGNQASTARILGLHRKYLQRLIKMLEIN
jgi:transcriptional regulator with PAS, ATPase and Fis domain